MKRINWTILFLVMFLLILGALMIVLDMYHVFSRPKYTAFFEEISLSCEIEDDVCDVIAPIYTSDDYEILGWSKDIKKEQADYQINETVTLTGNTTFYVVKRKKLKAEFILQDNNLSTETEASFCYLYNDDLSCQIISPKFTGPDNYEILGWHTDKNSITALVSNNQTITIDQDIKYYSVIKKHLKATFQIQDSKAINEKMTEVSCELNNIEESCQIKVPIMTINDGYTFIGWNRNQDSIISEIKNDMISLSNNITYYSITKKNNPLVATFSVQNNFLQTSSEKEECYLYNGNSSCIVKTPLLTSKQNNTTVIGWSRVYDVTISDIDSEKEIAITDNTNFYGLFKTKVIITFTTGENIDNVNVKASKLSFNYTDTNFHTIVSEEGQSLSTSCISYNGDGCKIIFVPVIYSEGYYIEGFSKEIGGKVIDVSDTLFKEDTILYARTGYCGGKKVNKTNVIYSKIYGNIMLEIDSKLGTNNIKTIENFFNVLYNYYPELFYYNGKITLYEKNNYYSTLEVIYPDIKKSGGLTFSDKKFSNVSVLFNNSSYSYHSIVHELGHALNYLYHTSFGKYISKDDTIVNLVNKYKNLKNRPLRDYSYTNISARTEFVSDALAETIRILLYEKSGKYYYDARGSLTSDIKNAIVGYLANERKYLEKEGKIIT